jgi:hypothetical protein
MAEAKRDAKSTPKNKVRQAMLLGTWPGLMESIAVLAQAGGAGASVASSQPTVRRDKSFARG